MTFWLIAGGLTFLVFVVVAASLLRGRAGRARGTGSDIQVYRDQLAEVDRDLARGTLSREEAARTRTEISRRLLAADKAAQAAAGDGTAPAGATWAMIGVAALILIGGTGAVYYQLGANRPGTGLYPDMGLAKRIQMADELRANRPSQATFEADLPAWSGPPPETPQDYLDLIEKLRKAVAAHPDDLQGNQLLALHEARLGNFVAAHKAMQKVLEVKGEDATADDYSQYADLLVMAANGYVSPEAEAALKAALERNPRDPVARYYTGLMFAQTGRPDRAFRLWRDLLEESRDDAPWVEPIRSQIGQLAAEAGVNYTPPATGTRGPSGADIASAQSMSPEERQAMIEGMVAQLSERLANQGGSAQEWAQLIGALAVLGREEEAVQVWNESRQVFADTPEDLARVNAAADRAGLRQADTAAPASPPADTAPAPAQTVEPGAAPAGAPAAAPGPSAADIQAAQEMTPEERQTMIEGMVARLAKRLASEGGPAQDWSRLIGALAVLGRSEQAQATWREAERAFADNPADLANVRAAAERAGLDTSPVVEPSAQEAARLRQIDNRVTDLSDKLFGSGGPASEWAELIGLLGELGETDKARQVWTDAQAAFASSPADLETVRAAASQAGVAE